MMRTTYLWFILGSLVGGAVFGPEAAHGQSWDAAAIHYGDGVRAYFSGSSSRAEQSLSSALAMNPQDPRIYYFRALSLLRQGRAAEARGDMMVGAALEAQYSNRFAVGAALERVQGHDRLLLEQYRRQARAEAGVNNAPRRSAAVGHKSEVLRQRIEIPLHEYLSAGLPQPARAATVDTAVPRTFAPSESPSDPFRDDPRTPAGRAPVESPAPIAPRPPSTDPAVQGDPFGRAAIESAPQGASTPDPSSAPAAAPADSNAEGPFGTL